MSSYSDAMKPGDCSRRTCVGNWSNVRLRAAWIASKNGTPRLNKGMHTARFFEVWLNVCDGPMLAATVAARAADLKSLGPLPWWRSNQDPDACNRSPRCVRKTRTDGPAPRDRAHLGSELAEIRPAGRGCFQWGSPPAGGRP